MAVNVLRLFWFSELLGSFWSPSYIQLARSVLYGREGILSLQLVICFGKVKHVLVFTVLPLS